VDQGSDRDYTLDWDDPVYESTSRRFRVNSVRARVSKYDAYRARKLTLALLTDVGGHAYPAQ